MDEATRDEDVARNIVNQLADLWGVGVQLRQATNDKADAFVTRLIGEFVSVRSRNTTEGER